MLADQPDVPVDHPGVSMGPMRLEDLDQIVALEKLCFSNPWSRAVFEATLISPLVYTLVQRNGDEVLGYLMAFRQGSGIEIGNVAVAPAHRRQGLGHQLMSEALRVATEEGRRSARLSVRESSTGAIHLYESIGFEQVGVSLGYYRSPPEDALLMRKNLR